MYIFKFNSAYRFVGDNLALIPQDQQVKYLGRLGLNSCIPNGNTLWSDGNDKPHCFGTFCTLVKIMIKR